MPKRLLAIMVLAIVAAPVGASAEITGNSLLEQCTSPELSFNQSFCLGFIQGVQDTLSYVFVVNMVRDGTEKLYPGDESRGGIGGVDSCPPITSTLGQLHLIAIKWMKENPEKLHRQGTIIVHQALVDAFPCPDPAPEKKK